MKRPSVLYAVVTVLLFIVVSTASAYLLDRFIIAPRQDQLQVNVDANAAQLDANAAQLADNAAVICASARALAAVLPAGQALHDLRAVIDTCP